MKRKGLNVVDLKKSYGYFINYWNHKGHDTSYPLKQKKEIKVHCNQIKCFSFHVDPMLLVSRQDNDILHLIEVCFVIVIEWGLTSPKILFLKCHNFY